MRLRRALLILALLNLLGLTSCAEARAPLNTGRPATEAVLGVDLGASTRFSSRTGLDAGAIAARSADNPIRAVKDEQAGVPATGVVNSVDPSQKRINLSHQPIPAIGWPAMTMDFPVDPAVDLRAVRAGSRVAVSLRKGKDGMYQIQSIKPLSGP